MRNSKRQIKIGIILNYIIIALNSIVGLVYIPYLLRMLGQNQYGLYSLVASLIAYLTILDLGFGSAVVRYTAKLKAKGLDNEQYELFGMFLILYIIIGLIAFSIGILLYANIETFFGHTMTLEDIQIAKKMVFLLVLNIAFTFPLSVFGSILQAYEEFTFLKTLEILRILLTTCTMIILLQYGYKALALVVVQTVYNILLLAAHCIYAFYKLKIKIAFGKIQYDILKEVVVYSFWIFIMIIVDKIYWNTGQFVLGASIGTIAVAIYSVGIQLHIMYQQFSTAMASVFLPKVTSMVTLGDNKEEISNLFIKTGRLQYIIMSFILSGFIIFGKSFIQLWAGKDYEEAFWVALIFLLPSTIPLIQNLGIVILQARNQMKFRALCYIFIAIGSLILQIIMVKYWGILGCALAIGIALIIGQIITMNVYYYRIQKINIPKFWSEIIKMSIMPCLYAIAAGYILNRLIDQANWGHLIISILIYSLGYFPIAYYTQLNNYEKDLIYSFKDKAINIFKNIKQKYT